MSTARSMSRATLVLRPILFIIPLFFFSPSNLGETNASDGMTPAINSAESRSLLEITAIDAEPAPGLGVPFLVTIEVISTSDQETALIAIDAEAPVQVLSESRRVETSLRANVPERQAFTLQVQEPGQWAVIVSAAYVLPDSDPVMVSETVGLSIGPEGGEMLRAREITWAQPEARHPAEQAAEAFELQDYWLMAIPEPGPGEIQIEGRLFYESRMYDGDYNGNSIRDSGDLIENGVRVLPRVIVELWNRHALGDELLDNTRADATGFYRFTPVENRSDLDLYLLVYASDYERAGVIDETGYIFQRSGEYTGSMDDGTHSFNYTIPLSPLGALFRPEQAFYIYDKLANDAYGFVQGQIHWDDHRYLTVHWPKSCILGIGGACFRGDIYLQVADGETPDVILHEYGHFVLSRYIGGSDVILACLEQGFTHFFWTESDPVCAWSEGWADFFEMAVQNDPDYAGADHEHVDGHLRDDVTRVGGDPEAFEDVVASVLWDLYDGVAGEDFDQMADGWDGPADNGIWTFASEVLPPSNTHVSTIEQFWFTWKHNRPDGACYASAIFQHHLLEYPPLVFTLATSVDPAGRGTVSASPAPNCPGDTYEDGTSVTLTASPASGYVFTGWSGDATGATNPLTIVMDSDKSITAQFAVPTPTPTPTPSPTPIPEYSLSGPYRLSITTLAGTQYAYDVNTVSQPAGTTFAGIVVFTDYHRTFFKDAQSLGYSPRLHGSSSPWDFGATWYCRTRFSGPQHPACVFAAGQLGVTFSTPRPTSYWNDAGAPGSTIYSALGIESTPCCKWPSVTAHLTAYYIWRNVPVTPTATHQPSQTPTGISTPGPTPTAKACTCPLLWLFGSCSRTSVPGGNFLAALVRPFRMIRQAALDIQVFYRIRDEVLNQTSEGQRMIDLFEAHGPEITRLLQENTDLSDEAITVLEMWQPNLQALAEGQGDEVIISQDQVQAIDAFLDHLSGHGSQALRQTIDDQRARWPIEEADGMTMGQAWGDMNNLPPTAEAGGPYETDEGQSVVLDASGSTDPDNNIVLYEWDLDWDGEFDDATGVTAEVTFGDNGPFMVAVKVADTFGEEATDTAQIIVGNLPPAAVLETSDAIAFNGGDAFLGRAGVAQTHEASATDPGSDDLTFAWDFASTTTYFNNGVDADPFPSPIGLFPFTTVDTASLTFASPGKHELDLTVIDDDGGSSSVAFAKLITGAQVCTFSQGFWKHQFSGQGRQQVDDDTLQAYLAIVNHASALFSEATPLNTLPEASTVMDAKGSGMRPKAQAQLLAAWLNFAHGSVGWDEAVDTNGDGIGDMAFSEVVTQAEAILINPNAGQQELVRAKDLAEAVNLLDQGTEGCE